ncbi:MAG TPA: methyltransferase domain-containing protein, partial [Candidatus Saccharimonadia bacterium]|nr:methyltransferase domain-containing protein [Candidatus Saccharimonadia bacterium]
GLSKLAADELKSTLNLSPVATARIRKREQLWVQTSDPAGLLSLRMPEDVFVEADRIKLVGQDTDLKALVKLLSRPETLGAAVRVYEHLAGRPLPGRIVFRVVAQADDVSWRDYRRVDLQTAAQTGIARAYPGWRLNAEEAPIEVWLHQVGRQLAVSLRLTRALHIARRDRVVEREAALRPTIAAAMVLASRPGDEDVFLDPMCGSGTILLERAQAGRHGLLLGGDIDAAAVRAALANFGPRHKPRRIERMDARKLPLENASVDKYVSNLPWGIKINKPEDLPVLYAQILAEAVRVVRSGGILVLLTSQWDLLKRLVKAQPKLKFDYTVTNIEVMGRRADMFVLHRL